MAVNTTLGCARQLDNLHALAYFICSVSLIAGVQNILTIVTIYRTVSLHTTTNMIIVSMNIGETFLSVCFLGIALIFYSGVIDLTNSGTWVDTFVMGLFFFAEMLSSFHFVIVAIDRYIYISHPFAHIKYVTRSCITKIIFGCWFVAVIILCIPLFLYRNDSYHEICIFLKPPIEYYSAACTAYLAILTIVFFCDFKIALLAFRRKKSAISRRVVTSSDISMSDNNLEAAIRSVKFFACTFGIFSACTLPSELTTMVNYFITVPFYVKASTICLYEINHIVEFYVLIYMCKDFYHALKRMFQT